MEAIETAVHLVRDGEIVVMFPEGTRREKGLAKKREARPHTGSGADRPRRRLPLVPAAIKGTDRLSRLGPVRVAYGAPIEARRPARRRRPRGGPGGHGPPDGRDRAARGRPVTGRPLLVVDGDSLAHRAYHALPKSIRRAERRPGNAIVGFRNFLLGLYDAEEPRAVLVGWDSLDTPTYRHEAFADYQSGRVFDAELLEQLDLLPQLVEAFGFAAAKAPGYEADDFLAAAVAAEEERGGTALVATSDRDAFQLVSERTTVLQPRAASARSRDRAGEVRERYGVDPEQVPDFIALRGDPSDKLPGARGRGQARGRPARAVRVARGGAGRGPLRRRGGGSPPVPSNRDDGRLRPALPSP